MSDWQPIETAPLNQEVQTCIWDECGHRNDQTLVAKKRNSGSRVLWWYPDGSMYVYYTPTHWRPK